MVRVMSGDGAARDQRIVAFPAVYINPLANYGTTLVGVAILGHDGIDHELLRDRAHEVLGEVRGYTLEALGGVFTAVVAAAAAAATADAAATAAALGGAVRGVARGVIVAAGVLLLLMVLLF